MCGDIGTVIVAHHIGFPPTGGVPTQFRKSACIRMHWEIAQKGACSSAASPMKMLHLSSIRDIYRIVCVLYSTNPPDWSKRLSRS